MTLREQAENREKLYFSPFASLSSESRGRERAEIPCDIRTDYQRDRDRILHSKSFRRLKHKTQVFLSPVGDHYRTRLTHTLEVSQLSRTIARALRMNEDLVDAIALGHDLGHTPFGHAGERALNEICPYGFSHVDQSLRVVEILEKKGQGLNLTWEVRDGIVNHRTSGSPHTLEGQIVRYCDKIAYINHDIDDAERAGILKEEDIPKLYRSRVGYSTRERLNVLIHDVINSSLGKAQISLSDEMEEMIRGLRKFMFTNVYQNPLAKGEEPKAKEMLKRLYVFYCEHPEKMPDEYQLLMIQRGEPKEKVVCDYISGMTDEYSAAVFKDLFIPQSWHITTQELPSSQIET